MELKQREVTSAESERPAKSLPPVTARRFETRAVTLDEHEAEPLEPSRHGVRQLKARQDGQTQSVEPPPSLNGLKQRIQAKMHPGSLSGSLDEQTEQSLPELLSDAVVQQKATVEAPHSEPASAATRHQDSRSSGNPLQDSVRDKMEGAFGADFSSVRVHTDGQADAIGAQAFTQGDDIHFGQGQYAPENSSGQELLGHELTHVLQQRAGRVSTTTQARGLELNDDAGLEKEADLLGAQAAQGQVIQVPGHSRQETLAAPVVQAKFLPGQGPIQLKGKPVTPAVLKKVEALLQERAKQAPNGVIAKFFKAVKDESQRQQAYGELIQKDCVYDNGGTREPFVPRIHPNNMTQLREVLRAYTSTALENSKGSADLNTPQKEKADSEIQQPIDDTQEEKKTDSDQKSTQDENVKKTDDPQKPAQDEEPLKTDGDKKITNTEDENKTVDEKKSTDEQKAQEPSNDLKPVEEKKADDEKKKNKRQKQNRKKPSRPTSKTPIPAPCSKICTAVRPRKNSAARKKKKSPKAPSKMTSKARSASLKQGSPRPPSQATTKKKEPSAPWKPKGA
ncbi:MAG: DUF4157 domain-containing protein [Myxococcota bacterium]